MFENENDIFGRGLQDIPLYRKGAEIYEIVCEIVELIPEENLELGFVKDIILEDAAILNAKFVNAENAELYDIKMENATIIRKAANDLLIQSHTLEMFGFEHVAYYSIVNKLIEEYRLLFIDWVKGFDKFNYIIDRWGLFNPPGVGPFDKDIDDEI